MSDNIRSLCVAAILLVRVGSASAADSVSLAETRELVRGGVEHYNAGQYVDARAAFREAFGVAPVPAIAWWAARAHEKLGELVIAAHFYTLAINLPQNRYWADVETQRQAQSESIVALKAVLPRVQSIRLEFVGGAPTSVDVEVDHEKVPSYALQASLPLEPGNHIVVTRANGKAFTNAIALAKNAHVLVRVVLTENEAASTPRPVTSGTPSPTGKTSSGETPPKSADHGSAPAATQINLQRHAAWVGFGIGAAGLAFGLGAGIVTWIKHSALADDQCASSCPEGTVSRSRVDNYNTWRDLSVAGFVVGGLGAAAGTAMLVTLPSGAQNAKPVGFTVGPSGVGVSGAF